MNRPAPSHPVAAVGDIIAGKYRVEGLLGSGGMGIVLAATHLDLERLVAVKVMRAEMGEHPDAVQRLLLEAKLAARFRNEHVCKVLDVGTLESGAPYIVMEYLEGVDLATLLSQQGPLDAETAVDFILEICEALTEAHTSQIVHRDLKPENLFVARSMDGTPCIKVLDFGISKQVGVHGPSRNLTNPSAALGSPYYMAPEQMRSARDVDARADIWAVGAILFELLTGRQAFAGETLPEVCANVMHTRPPRVCDINSELPFAVADVIERCLNKDPSLRFNDVGELALALAPFGSPKAQESLERIERSLTGKELGSARMAKDPAGRYRLGPSEPRSSSKPGLKSTPTGPPLQVTLVDARGVQVARPARARVLGRWLILAGVAGVCVLVVIRWRGGPAFAPRASLTGLDGDTHAAQQPPAAAPAAAEAMPAPSSAPPEPEHAAVAAKPTEAESAPAASTNKPSPRLRSHAARVPAPTSAVVPPPSAATSTAPKPNFAQAWDSTSFGPRR
jgi:eukaryotic-like serine/threonine-protein kinase